MIIDRRKTINKRKIKNLMRVLMFILPALIPLGVFWLFPMGEAIFMSFTDWDYMSSAYNIVGFDNYRNIFSDSMFYDALKKYFSIYIGNSSTYYSIGSFSSSYTKKENNWISNIQSYNFFSMGYSYSCYFNSMELDI